MAEKPRPRKTPPLSIDTARADEALHAEIGIPVGALTARFTEAGAEYGRAWADYSIDVIAEVVGMVEPNFDRSQLPWPSFLLLRTAMSTMTTLWGDTITVDPSGDPCLLKSWYCRVRCDDVPGYIEARWHPTPGGVGVYLRNLDGADYQRANRALLGLQLLYRRFPTPGRPPGDRMYGDRDRFLQKASDAAEALEYDEEPVTQEAIANKLGMSSRSLRKRIREFNIDWDRDIKRRGR